jgi:hypothetical protein
MKKVDLSDLKEGDKAWSVLEGEGEVKATRHTKGWCIRINGKWYAKNGHANALDQHPTLFHSEQEFREYWGLQRDTNVPLTKREQFAMAAIQGLLANENYSTTHPDVIAEISIKQADFMLTKLNK